MSGDAPRAEITIVVECGGGFVLAIFVGISTVLVSDVGDEVRSSASESKWRSVITNRCCGPCT
jgi:hypothetical protein